MKHTFKTLLLAGALVSLGACETMGLGDTDEMSTPYNLNRTAQHEQRQTPAPVKPAPVAAAPACGCDCDALSARANQAERELSMCMESKGRVSDAYRDELMK